MCPFYLPADVLEPWTEDLDPVPTVGAALDQHGEHFLVQRVMLRDWPGIRAQEASIWLIWAEPDPGS